MKKKILVLTAGTLMVAGMFFTNKVVAETTQTSDITLWKGKLVDVLGKTVCQPSFRARTCIVYIPTDR